MTRVRYILIISIAFAQYGCQKYPTEDWSGVYKLDFYTKIPITGEIFKKSEPNGLRVEVIGGQSVRISNFLTVPLDGNRFQADIVCCTNSFYAAYELTIDGTFSTKKGVSTIEGFHYVVNQAGPFSGIFKMKKIGP